VSLLTGFKKFLLRGSAVDLAIGFIVGAAFTSVVKALVADIFTPLIALIFGEPQFENLKFAINHSQFRYGDLINNIITFLSVSAVMYFFVVTPITRLKERRAEADPDTKACPECTSAIPLEARRCPLCTSQLATE
jgi:large conductance mechanosensitive channel